MRIKEHPAVLVLILTMGLVFSSNASVLQEGLIRSVIAWADDYLFCVGGLASVSESPSICLMDARKGTNLSAIQ